MATIKSKDRPPSGWHPPEEPGPLFAWGRSPFAPHDGFSPDGARVGGVRIVKAPDGTLVGIVDDEPERVKDENQP